MREEGGGRERTETDCKGERRSRRECVKQCEGTRTREDVNVSNLQHSVLTLTLRSEGQEKIENTKHLCFIFFFPRNYSL